MSDDESGGGSCGGCLLTILLVWALIFGLPTPWGVLNVDVLPPRIWRDEGVIVPTSEMPR